MVKASRKLLVWKGNDNLSELVVKDLSISLKEKIVKEISFTIPKGESLIILGKSGSGKTLTIKAIMGLLNKKKFSISGNIEYKCEEVLESDLLIGKRIVMVPQNPMTALNPSIRIGKQMLETLNISFKVDDAKTVIYESLVKQGIKNPDLIWKKYPYQLSGGTLQRIVLAMATMVKPEFILADEPTTALDVVNKNHIIDSFLELRRNGVGLLFVTHDFRVAQKLDGEVLVMNDGEIIERGLLHNVLKDPKCQYTRDLIEATIKLRERAD